MDKGVAAVRLQFPTRVMAIEELALRDAIFCEICSDFAEAQTELARWNAASGIVRDERIAEYSELVAALGKEIEDALDRAVVVSLHRGPGSRSA